MGSVGRLGESLANLWKGLPAALAQKPGGGPRAPLPGYAIAVLAVGITLVLKLLLDPLIEEASPFLLFFSAIVVAAWFGGLGPGLLATALAALVSDYFFLAPIYSFQVGGSGQVIRFAIFLLEGAFISLLVETIHAARRYAEARTLQSQKDQEELRRSEERFRATFEGAPVGIAHVGLGGEWLRVNRKLCEIVGYAREELLGLTFQDITHPDDLRKDLELFGPLTAGELAAYSIEKRYLRKDGPVVWIDLTVSAARDEEGRPEYCISVIEDITERKRAEQALRRSEARHIAVVDTAFDAIVTMTRDGVIRSFNQGAERIFGYTAEEAIGESLALLMPERFREDHAAGLRRYLETGEAHVIGRRMVELAGRRKDGEEFPLELSLAEVGEGEDSLFTGIMRDITERKRAEEVQRFLIEAGALLSSSLDYRATLASVTRLAVPYLADWCIVDVLEEDGWLDRVAVAHEDPEKVALAHELQERYPPDLDESQGAPQVLRTGQSVLARELPDALLDEAAVDEEHREILRGLGLKSYMIVPLIARGRTLGAMTLVSAESERRYGAADLELAEELARRAALAVDNARLYKGRSDIARVLQQGLLPSRLPEVPGVEVGLRYLPAGEVDVGGDFYDLFDARVGDEAGALESSTWGVVIGDVCGKGAEAAAVLALARYTLRAVARREARPSAVLAGLNEVMLRQRRERDDHKFCTIAYVRLDTDAEPGARITVSRGGHLVPLLLEAGGGIQKIGHPGRAIGVFEDANLAEEEARLAPGDALVLYTDGVLEARSPDGAFFGEERLMALLRSCAGLDASTIAGRIESAVLEFQENVPGDDVAVLVVRVPE